MSLDVEDLLRSGMERLTEPIQPPAGLTQRAVSAHRRRRRARVAAAGTAAAVAAAVTVLVTGAADVTPVRTRAGVAQAHTVGYVLTRVANALSASNMVVRTETTFSPAFPAITQWNYRGNYRSVQSGSFREAGVPWAQGPESWGYGTALVGGKRIDVGVDYRYHRWYAAPGGGLTLNACWNALWILQADGGPVNWAPYIRQAVSCGKFRIAGQALIGGKQTITITGWERRPSWLGRNALTVGVTLYVDPSTYVPLLATWTNRSHTAAGFSPLSGTVRQDIRLLPATPGNVALATVTIPAGFRKVPDATFGGPMYQFTNWRK
jgi:hypothetical protein